MSKVNIFVIGAPKCGTTSLVDYLNQLNKVSKMVPKEPYYWSKDIPVSMHEISSTDVEAYESLVLDPNAEGAVDGSTRYLRSTEAPKRIKEYNENAKIIVMLRNPVDVVHAYHMEQVFCGHEDELDFESAWAKQPARREGKDLPLNCNGYNYLDYQNICMFGSQVENWMKYFNKDQIYVVNFDDFKADSAGVFKKIVQFLGVDVVEGEVEGVDFKPKNASHARKNRKLANFILYRIGFLKPLLDWFRVWMNSNPDSFLSGLKRKMFHTATKRKPMTDELSNEIALSFSSDQELLNDLVGFKHI